MTGARRVVMPTTHNEGDVVTPQQLKDKCRFCGHAKEMFFEFPIAHCKTSWMGECPGPCIVYKRS